MSSELLTYLYSFQPEAPELRSKAAYDQAARAFVQACANIAATQFTKGADGPQDPLELLNPAVNSIAYTYTLLARITTTQENPKQLKHIPDKLQPGGTVWNKLVQYLETFDPIQIRYVGPEWRRLVEYVSRVARILGSPGIAISPIRSAMLRLDPTTGTFTTTHLDLIQLCMETRSYTAALPILDNYIHSISTNIPKSVLENLGGALPCAEHTNSGEYIHLRSGHSGRITVQDIQEYYLLGAMAYTGVHEFKKAVQFLEHVLATPSHNVANGLMLESYKKWLLLSCLAYGKTIPVPRGTNSNAMKHIKNASKAYEALADAFTKLDIPKLRAEAEVGSQVWADDGNTGLVKALLENQTKVVISRLQNRYSALPVTKISELLNGLIGPEEIVTYLETLINSRELNARLDKVKDLVVLRFFLDPTQGPLAKSEKEHQQALLEQTERTSLLAEQVKSADYRLSITKEFAQHLQRQNKKQAANGAGDAMDMSWDDGADGEEDMMADLH